MAEGLALAASVIAVLQITNSVISVCYDYSVAVKGASWELPRLRSELESLRNVLQQLEPLAKQAEFAQATPNARLPAFAQLCGSAGPLQLCFLEIRDLEAVLQSPSWSDGFGPKRKALVQVLRWPLKEKETEKARERIGRFRDILSFALTADQIALSLEISRLLHATNDAVQDSKVAIHSLQQVSLELQDRLDTTQDIASKAHSEIESAQLDSRKKAIDAWLSAPDPSTNYQRGRRSREATTGTWFTSGEVFLRWKDEENAVLWLHGKPGCGKTVLFATIITELAGECHHRSNSYLTYFFFDFNDLGKQKSEQMVRSLIAQSFRRSSDTFTEIESLFASCTDGKRQPDIESLIASLERMLGGECHTYIVVDALDECADLHELLKLIIRITSWENPRIHLLLTSRGLLSIEEAMEDLAKPANKVEIHNDEDISLYVRGRLQNDSRLQRWRKSPGIQDEIRSNLMQKADGMFRWTVCQLDALQYCPNISTLRKTLSSLPKTLDETYDRILCSIPEEYSEYAFKILLWLTHSTRPLKLEELAEVIAVNTEGPPWFDEEALFPEPKDLIAICSSLVVAKPLRADGASTSSDIRLAHFSVKEYLVSERIQHRKAAIYSISETRSDESIAATCLAYLLQFDQESHLNSTDLESGDEYPLLSYAARQWTRHARNLGPHTGPLERLSLELFRRNRTTYAFWVRQRLPFHHDDGDRREDLLPLLMMARDGVVGMVQMLLDSHAPINEIGNYGSALWWATAHGHDVVVKLLLAHGAEVNIEHSEFSTRPLEEASRFGYIGIINALIDAGADVNYGTRFHPSALLTAAKGDRLDVVQLLTSRKAQVNQESGDYTTALIAACTASPQAYAIAQHLLGNGADITTINEAVGTALHAACAKQRADVELIGLLISAGAVIEALGGKYGTALQAACSHHRNDEVIRLLISKGADPRTVVPGSKYGTALQAVCAETHDNDAIVRLLLENGASRDVQGGKYGTALQAACAQNNLKTVKLLLRTDGGVEGNISPEESGIRAYGGAFGSALNAACRRSRKEIALLLLESGADINGTREFGRPLVKACETCSIDIVKLLLDRGADITVQAEAGGRGPRNVLEAVLGRSWLEEDGQLLQILYKHGAEKVESWLEAPKRQRWGLWKESFQDCTPV